MQLKLFMLLLGCTLKGRFTEQHDVFFGIGNTLKDLVPDILRSWPEAEGNIHIDAWREVRFVDNYSINVFSKQQPFTNSGLKDIRLFFLNLGGYKQNEFDEYHYKLLTAVKNKTVAIQQAKATAFYKHTGFKSAESHIDDKYGVDVDDVYEIQDILPGHLKEKYTIELSATTNTIEDQVHLGYFRLDKL